MPSLPPRFNFGQEIKNYNPVIYNQLNDVYFSISKAVNSKPSRQVAASDPVANTAFNASFEIGDIWINTTMDTAYIMTSRTTSTNVTWTLIT